MFNFELCSKHAHQFNIFWLNFYLSIRIFFVNQTLYFPQFPNSPIFREPKTYLFDLCKHFLIKVRLNKSSETKVGIKTNIEIPWIHRRLFEYFSLVNPMTFICKLEQLLIIFVSIKISFLSRVWAKSVFVFIVRWTL